MGESTRTAFSPDGWKLSLRDTGEHELYHLREDPGEMHNRFASGRQDEVIARLTGEIRRWQERTGDRLQLA